MSGSVLVAGGAATVAAALRAGATALASVPVLIAAFSVTDGPADFFIYFVSEWHLGGCTPCPLWMATVVKQLRRGRISLRFVAVTGWTPALGAQTCKNANGWATCLSRSILNRSGGMRNGWGWVLNIFFY